MILKEEDKEKQERIDNGSGTSSDYSDVANAYINEYYGNTDGFKYDVNTDELYKTYKQQYQNNAQKSMQNSIAQASGLTGGYASTYAQSAGQQAYDNTMQGLNDMIPSLYQMAENRYETDRQKMLEKGQYYQSIASNMEENANAYNDYYKYFEENQDGGNNGKKFGKWELDDMQGFYEESDGDYDAFKTLVNDKFGSGGRKQKNYSDEDIQYLYKYAQDKTANSYKDVFSKIDKELYVGKTDDEIADLATSYSYLSDEAQYQLYLLLKEKSTK